MNRSTVEENWHTRGFSCDVWVDPPGQIWENFVHRVDELFMVIEGDVELELPGKKWCPQPGEEVLIPAGAVHSVRNLGQTTSRWFYGYKQTD